VVGVAAGAGVTVLPGVAGTGVVGVVAAGKVAVGLAGAAERWSKPGIKRTPKLASRANARITAPSTTHGLPRGRGGRCGGWGKTCLGGPLASCTLSWGWSDGGAGGPPPCSCSISCWLFIGLLLCTNSFSRSRISLGKGYSKQVTKQSHLAAKIAQFHHGSPKRGRTPSDMVGEFTNELHAEHES
jgi:hypothetical protein